MKRKVLILFAVSCATTVMLAQGTVRFDNNLPGVVVSRVFGASPSHPPQAGNGPADFPPGSTVWSAFPLVIGGGMSAQLFAAPGANVPASSLLPALPITTFLTGDSAGFVVGTTATLTGVPADAPVATLQLRVWNNVGGTVTDWNTAQNRSFIEIGVSPTFNVQAIGGSVNPPPALAGLVSFSLIVNNSIPEPTPVGLFGVAALVNLLARGLRRQLRAGK